jgi:hypothetical protein
VTDAVLRAVGGGSSAGIDFVDRGEHTLKGVRAPQRLYAAMRVD